MDGEFRFREHVMVVAYSVLERYPCKVMWRNDIEKGDQDLHLALSMRTTKLAQLDYFEEFARFASQRLAKDGALSDQIRACTARGNLELHPSSIE